MRILIENSGYALTNMGDVAMLQSAVERMRQILPAAELRIVTTSPDRLQRFCPSCSAVNAVQFACWRSMKVLPCSYRLAGARAKERLRKLDAQIRFRFPRLALGLMRASARAAGGDGSGVNAFWNAVQTSDAVVATGGGYFTDAFPLQAMSIIDTLRLAQQSGKPTAFFGQGLGPLSDVEIKKKLRKTLCHANVIGLRENRKGLVLLESLGVASEHVITTGDDAIEMARKQTPPAPGRSLGFNVRVASYAGLSGAGAEFFRAALRSLAAELRAPVVSIPIETKREDSDVIALQTIIPPDICQNANFAPNEPLEVIQEIARCRAIITGSYHAGVFALAMGIPVVALVKSEYYADKFFGLQKQFGSGMAIIELDAPDPAAALSESVRKLWAEAAGFREKLLQAADGQIAEGRRAFREFFGQLR